MTNWTLSVIGNCEFSSEQEIRHFTFDRVQALLVYLACENRSLSRSQLAGLLWPDHNEEAARTNLRRALADLKQALKSAGDEEPLILAGRNEIQINPAASLRVDLHEYLRLSSQVLAHQHNKGEMCDSCQRALQQAVALYSGSFLENFYLKDSVEFEEWAQVWRSKLETTQLKNLASLFQAYENQMEYEQALTIILKAQGLDPYNSVWNIAEVRLLALSGQLESARKKAEEYILAQMFDEDAERDMQDLSDRLKNLPWTALHNLPRVDRSFIGRQKELQQTLQFLDNPHERLFAIEGNGGTGKTRLAIQAAARRILLFPHGVWFFSALHLNSETVLLTTIASQMGIRLTPSKTLVDILLDQFKQKQMLLIFDGCEHLPEATTELVQKILSTCPGVKLITTNRNRLPGTPGKKLEMGANGPGEFRPASTGIIPAPLSQFEAVSLFIDRAAAQSGFIVNDLSAPPLAQVCFRSRQNILAIELAAGALTSLPIIPLWQSLEASFERLGENTAEPDLALITTLEWSYALLSAAAQSVLRQSAVFHSSWDMTAAEAVCVPNDMPLAAVIEELGLHRLLHTETMGGEKRFYLLDVIQEFARFKLEQTGELETCAVRHLSYYSRLAQTHAGQIQSAQQVEAITAFEKNQPNFRQALRFAISSGRRTEAHQLCSALWMYWYMRGYLVEGYEWAQAVLSMPDDRPDTFRMGTLVIAGNMALAMGNFELAAGLYNQALPISVAAREEGVEMRIKLNLGTIAFSTGQFETAASAHQKGLEIARERAETRLIPGILINLANALRSLGEEGRAAVALEEAIPLLIAQKDLHKLSMALNNLGVIYRHAHDYTSAIKHYQDSLEIKAQLGDRPGIAATWINLGYLYHQQGTLSEARLALNNAYEVLASQQTQILTADWLEVLAGIYLSAHKPEAAANAIGLADHLRLQNSTQRPESEVVEIRQLQEALSQALGPRYTACYEKGRDIELSSLNNLLNQLDLPAEAQTDTPD